MFSLYLQQAASLRPNGHRRIHYNRKNITQQTHPDGSSQNDSDSEAVELDESIEQDTQETTDTLINIINNVYGDDEEGDADFSFGAQNEMSNFYKVIEYAKEE